MPIKERELFKWQQVVGKREQRKKHILINGRDLFDRKFDDSHLQKKRECMEREMKKKRVFKFAMACANVEYVATYSISKSLFNPLHSFFWTTHLSFHLSHFHVFRCYRVLLDFNGSDFTFNLPSKERNRTQKNTFKSTLSLFCWLIQWMFFLSSYSKVYKRAEKKSTHTHTRVAK